MPCLAKATQPDGTQSAAGALFSVGAVWAIIAALMIFAAGRPARAAEPGDVEDIVHRVEAVSRIPANVRMEQSVVARVLLFSWRFTSVLEYVDGELTATTQGAPSFVPETFPVDLVRLGQALSLFDLRVVEGPDENGFIVLSGPRSGYDGTGAQEATFMIDPSDWLVKRASAKYPWGTLSLEQEFDSFDGRMLLRRQKGSVRPLGLTVEVEYSNHTFVDEAGESLTAPGS